MKSSSAAFIVASPFLLILVVAPCSKGACAEQIVVAGKVVARISAPAQFGSLAHRSAAIDKRIADAISVEDVGSPKMRTAVVGGVPAIFVGDTMLVKVYPEDARRYRTAPKQLAQAWAANFATQLPLAEPSIHMGNAMAGSEFARAQARTAKSANVVVPQTRWAIVSVILDHLALARRLPDDAFEQRLPSLTQAVYRDILRFLNNESSGRPAPIPPHRPGACPEPGGCPACKAAKAAAIAPFGRRGEADGEGRVSLVPKTIERRVTGGLKLMRSVDDRRYKRDRVMVAYTILRAVEKSEASAR